MSEFAVVLRTYRKSLGWTQSELAEHWSYSFETISAWERGKRSPSGAEIPRLAPLLEMEVEQLAAMVLAGKGKRPGWGAAPMASHAPVEAPRPASPFAQGRFLWSLHFGVEEGGLKLVVSCPLDNGGVWDIPLDVGAVGGPLHQVYQLVQDRLVFGLQN